MEVSREAFYDYLNRKADPWKYEALASEMMKIHVEDEYNDCYGRESMYMALMQKKEAGEISIDIPCEGTVRKVIEQIGLIHKPRRKPNGITILFHSQCVDKKFCAKPIYARFCLNFLYTFRS